MFLYSHQLQVFLWIFAALIYFYPLSSMKLNHKNNKMLSNLLLLYHSQGGLLVFLTFLLSQPVSWLFIVPYIIEIFDFYIYSFFEYPSLLTKTTYPFRLHHFCTPLHVPTNSIPDIISFTEADRRLVGRLTYQPPYSGRQHQCYITGRISVTTMC